MRGVDWGDVPSWIEALVTALALGAAIYVARQGWRIYRIESGRDQAAAEDRKAARIAAERQHASRVTWWTDSQAHAGEPTQSFVDGAELHEPYDEMYGTACINILNSSDDCIYEASLQLPKWINETKPEAERFTWRQIGVLPPGRHRFEIPTRIIPTPTSSTFHRGDAAFNLHVEWLEFRDRNNEIWRRYGDGPIEKQPARKPVTRSQYPL